MIGWELGCREEEEGEEKVERVAMRKSFKDSLKALEADIQYANTLYYLLLYHFDFCFSPFPSSSTIFSFSSGSVGFADFLPCYLGC